VGMAHFVIYSCGRLRFASLLQTGLLKVVCFICDQMTLKVSLLSQYRGIDAIVPFSSCSRQI
jgi:hypothetical protein